MIELVIILYDNSSLFNSFNSNKHTNNLYINLSDINTNYDFNLLLEVIMFMIKPPPPPTNFFTYTYPYI